MDFILFLQFHLGIFSNCLLIDNKKDTYTIQKNFPVWIFTIIFILIYIPVLILVKVWHRKTQLKIEASVVLKESIICYSFKNEHLDTSKGKHYRVEKPSKIN